MMVSLTSCGLGECKQAVIDRERERERETITNKKRKGEHRTEYVPCGEWSLAAAAIGS
jgi:hypothetical protein